MSDNSTLAWVTPPPSRGGRFDWAQIAADLRAKPGEWAQVGTQRVPRSVASAVRRGRITVMRPTEAGRFEVRTRNQVGENADLFIRWVTSGTTTEGDSNAE